MGKTGRCKINHNELQQMVNNPAGPHQIMFTLNACISPAISTCKKQLTQLFCLANEHQSIPQ